MPTPTALVEELRTKKVDSVVSPLFNESAENQGIKSAGLQADSLNLQPGLVGTKSPPVIEPSVLDSELQSLHLKPVDDQIEFAKQVENMIKGKKQNLPEKKDLSKRSPGRHKGLRLVNQKNMNDDVVRVVSFAPGPTTPDLVPRRGTSHLTSGEGSKDSGLDKQLLSPKQSEIEEREDENSSQCKSSIKQRNESQPDLSDMNSAHEITMNKVGSPFKPSFIAEAE